MRLAGVRGVQRAAKAFTTRPDPTTARPTDRVQRQFRADRPNQLRVVPAMGRRHHLRANLAGLRLHRICHRCLHPRDRRLACCGYHTDRADQAASAWRTVEQVGLATCEWVWWYNQQRLHEALDYQPPTEFEAALNGASAICESAAPALATT